MKKIIIGVFVFSISFIGFAVEVGVDLFGYNIAKVKADCNPFGPSCYSYQQPVYVTTPTVVSRPVYYNPPPVRRSIESRNIHIENSPNAKVIINEERTRVSTTPTYVSPQPQTRVIYVPSNGIYYNNGYVPYSYPPPPPRVYYYRYPRYYRW